LGIKNSRTKIDLPIVNYSLFCEKTCSKGFNAFSSGTKNSPAAISAAGELM
jgi:hypothetical protein